MQHAQPQYMPERRPGSVAAGVAVSILLHGGLVGLAVLATMWVEPDPPEPPKLEFEKVELMALGEDKPDKRLPRIANPAPEPSPKDEVNVAKKDTKPEKDKKPEKQKKAEKDEKPEKEKKEKKDKKQKTEPKKKPEKKTESEQQSSPDNPPKVDPEQRKRKKEMMEAIDSLHNPNRPTNKDVPEGSKKGVAEGNLSEKAVDNLLGTYEYKLMRAIEKQWTVPSTVSRSQIEELAGEVVVYVELTNDGHIAKYEFERRSSNEQFNSSIERVLKKFRRVGGSRTVPLPDKPPIRKLVLKEGLDLKDWRYTGR